MPRSSEPKSTGPTATGRRLLRLTEVAEAAGVLRRTVEYYAMIGLIRETARTMGGQRLFDESVVRQVKIINRLNHSGYTLKAIKDTFRK